MRVLIIGINYRPEPTGIGPYTAGLAENLAARGDEVTVITGLPSYPGWRLMGGTPRRMLATGPLGAEWLSSAPPASWPGYPMGSRRRGWPTASYD
jgi:colanic acid biosynthesis glycosyl transferase WcaI